MSLSSKQIRALRAEVHRLKLKPVVIIGQNGLSANVLNELQQALNHHELIKIRIPAIDKADKASFIDTIRDQVQADIVQTIGHVVVLFRRNPDRDRFSKLLRP